MQQRHPPAALQGLLGAPAPVRGYRYVILNLWFVTITRRSISLGIATASLSFVALQARVLPVAGHMAVAHISFDSVTQS